MRASTDIAPKFSETTLLEERFEHVGRNNKSLIRVAERQGIPRKLFNTVENILTREITVTGIKLDWDESNDVLETLRITRDVSRIIIIADEISIAVPLLWMGANVEIYARKLAFRGTGKIDTTPEAFATVAFTQKRDDKGRPLNAAGKIQAKNGRSGEHGGNISLHVFSMEAGGTGITRLVTDGSPGEMGEPGGLLDFPQFTDGPETKDVEPVTFSQVKKAIKNTSNSTGDLGKLSPWFSTGGLGEDGLNKTWEKVTAKTGYTVTDVRLGLHFKAFIARKVNVISMPSMHLKDHDITVGNHDKVFQEMKQFHATHAPANGEDAFPSGATGKGGDAGNIRATPTAFAQLDGIVKSIGGASVPSETIDGGAAGTPSKYALVALVLVQDFAKTLDRKPSFYITTGERKNGANATGSKLGAGEDVVAFEELGPHDWLHPSLLTLVTDYARSLFAAGHRDQAWQELSAYWLTLQEIASNPETLSPDQRSGAQVVRNLVDKCRNNLDVYGNPPGWVPRFSANSYLQNYLSDRRFSYSFLGVMDNAVRLMDSIEQVASMLNVASEQTEDTIDQIRSELIAAYQNYADARSAIREAEQSLKSAETKLQDLEQRAHDLALIQERDKKILQAVFTVSGAILKAIPVYQPGLSAVATVVEGAGSFAVESIYGDEPTNGWQALSTIGGSVEKALKENSKGLDTQFANKMKSKYGLDVDRDTEDLKSKVGKLRTSLQADQKKHDLAMTKAHDSVSNSSDLQVFLKATPDAEAELLANAENTADLKRKIREHNALITDLWDRTKSKNLTEQEVATAMRQNLLAGRAKLYAALADAQNQMRNLETQKNAEADKLEAARARHADLEERREELDKLLPELKELESEEQLKKSTGTFKSVVEGIERVAKSTAVIGDAINGVVRGLDPDSEEVAAFKERILASDEMREDYLEAQEIVDKAQAKMNSAFQNLMAGNQAILTLSGDFVGAIQSSMDISRNRLQFALGVDGALKASFVSMRRQAEARMEYNLYLFRKAYMYETCRPAGEKIASLNTLTSSISSWVENATEAAQKLQDTTDENLQSLQFMNLLRGMKTKDAEKAAEGALRNILSELASSILNARSTAGQHFEAELGAEIPTDNLAQLSQTGETHIPKLLDLIAETDRDGQSVDLKKFFFLSPKRKVAKIEIEFGAFKFRRVKGSTAKNIRLRISFGRELILWNDEKFYGFRIGTSEQPLDLRWNARNFIPTEDPDIFTAEFVAVEAHAIDPMFEELVAQVAGDETGKKISFTEINPSLLTGVTVSIVLGHNIIEEITQFDLTLKTQAN